MSMVLRRRRGRTSQLRRSIVQAQLEALLRAAGQQAVFATDRDGIITTFGPGAERILGYASDEVVGRVSADFFHEPTEVAVRADDLGVSPGFDVLVHAARRGAPESREWTYVARDRTRRTVALSMSGIRGKRDNLVGFVGVATVVPEQLQAERLSMLSHDLATPLTSVRGYLELLTEGVAGDLTSEQDRLVDVALRNAYRVAELIADLVTTSIPPVESSPRI